MPHSEHSDTLLAVLKAMCNNFTRVSTRQLNALEQGTRDGHNASAILK
jgi:hypothetical protein